MNFGLGMMKQISAIAAGGPMALAGTMAQAMPGAMKAILYQRQAAIMIDLLSSINRACGECLAAALAQGHDLGEDELHRIASALAQAFALASAMERANAAGSPVLVELQQAYAGVTQAAQAAPDATNNITPMPQRAG